MTANRSFAA